VEIALGMMGQRENGTVEVLRLFKFYVFSVAFLYLLAPPLGLTQTITSGISVT